MLTSSLVGGGGNADMGEGGIQNGQFYADVIFARPLTLGLLGDTPLVE